MCLAIAGANPEAKIGFLDGEFNWVDSSFIWARDYFGIQPENLLVTQATYLEEAAEALSAMMEVCDIVILDGYDALAPQSEFESENSQQHMGILARAYKKFFRKTAGKVYHTNSSFLITNHIYDNVGNSFEPQKEPGGKCIYDFPSQKFWHGRKTIKSADKTEVIGQGVTVTVKKDKLSGKMGQRYELPYYNGIGFDVEEDIVNNAADLGVMVKSGSWYSLDGTNVAQGSVKAAQFLRDNPEIADDIWDKCMDIIKNTPEEIIEDNTKIV